MQNADTVLEPLHALIEDVRVSNPELHDGLLHDMEELRSRVVTRGISLILLDMPDLGRLYDGGLSSGWLDLESWPTALRRSGQQPHLFERLVRHSYSGSRYLTCMEPEPDVVFWTRCILYLYKKYDAPAKTGALESAVEEYVNIDVALPEPTLDWLDPSSSYGVKGLSFLDQKTGGALCRHTKSMLAHLDRICAVLRFPLGDAYTMLPKHGPGAVADLKRGEDKYTPALWPRKLETVFPRAHFLRVEGDLTPQSSPMLRAATPQSLWGVARLHDVPKTHKGPRLITVEPTAHQFIQGGLMRWIRQNMPGPYRQSVSFHDQAPSGQLALEASKDGYLATVDLSSASDRLSCWVVERFVGDIPLRAHLIACRTPFVDLSRYGVPELIQLRKFAGMGSAVTFPIQTLVYYCIAVAAVLYTNGCKRVTQATVRRAGKVVRVFGDDIILPSSAVPYLGLLLSYLDLRVNASKTHYRGWFRESCGTDAYKGYDVTPYYLRASGLGRGAEALSSWVDNRNVAYSKGLWTLARWFELNTPANVSRWIVRTNEDLGLLKYHSFVKRTYAKRWRWNPYIHTWECRGIAVTSTAKRVVRGTQLDLLQYFLESPGPEFLWEPGYLASNRAHVGPSWVAATRPSMLDE